MTVQTLQHRECAACLTKPRPAYVSICPLTWFNMLPGITMQKLHAFIQNHIHMEKNIQKIGSYYFYIVDVNGKLTVSHFV